jgi:hypothetical protein
VNTQHTDTRGGPNEEILFSLLVSALFDFSVRASAKKMQGGVLSLSNSNAADSQSTNKSHKLKTGVCARRTPPLSAPLSR